MGSIHRFPASTAVVAVCVVSSADAGLVGTNCSVSFFDVGTGVTYQDRSFIVSSLLPEFYYAVSFGNSNYGAISVDVKASSMSVTMDFNSGASLYFTPGTRLALTIPDSMQFDGFALGSSADITGLVLSDVSVEANRTLLIDTSLITGSAPGAYFTIDFTTSSVPGPSALVMLSACAAIPARRRRR